MPNYITHGLVHKNEVGKQEQLSDQNKGDN